MNPKAYVKPGRMASIMGIVVGIVMLILGMAFFSFLQNDGSDIGQIFMAFWMLIVVLIIAYYVYSLNARNPSSAAIAEIELDIPVSGSSGEEKLHSLERLKKEQLITEEEYQQKRKEIMQQKW
jgi:amino acid permease